MKNIDPAVEQLEQLKAALSVLLNSVYRRGIFVDLGNLCEFWFEWEYTRLLRLVPSMPPCPTCDRQRLGKPYQLRFQQFEEHIFGIHYTLWGGERH